jgi:drug/metabolite transporter (DMT)-like permease
VIRYRKTLLSLYAELVLAAACWGGGNVAVKYAVGGIPPMTLLMIELVAATAALWTVLLIRRRLDPASLVSCPATTLRRVALLGLFEPALAYAADNLGLTRTSAADASLLAGMESIFVVILAVLVLKLRISRVAVAAVLVATVGVAALAGSAPSLAVGWGDLLVLTGSLSAATYVTLASKIAPDLDALTMTGYQFLAGTVLSVPFVMVQWSADGRVLPHAATAGQWLAAIGSGVGGLALSFLLYNHAISRVNVATAGMILNLIPIFGLLGAIVLLGESLDRWEATGGVLILASLVAFTWAERPKEQPERAGPIRRRDPAPR